MKINKDLDKNKSHSELKDCYLQDIDNVNGLIRCRLSTMPITNQIILVMAKANILKPLVMNIVK